MLPGERFARGEECYAVESHLDGGIVVVELVHYRRRAGGFGHKHWTRLERVASERFGEHDIDDFWRYSTQLADAARHALDGELGAFVKTESLSDGSVRVRLVDRRMRDRRLATDILEDRCFDPTAADALVASAEFAEELRARARQLNDDAFAAAADADARAAQAAVDEAERARQARELAEIVRGESER
ncbi:MAG TPA: hypothetical protein VFR49_01600 [Solirubrobacteraceae bacterium]|nr:hypothetical protein [Solirubrobacteraceae bacterium]